MSQITELPIDSLQAPINPSLGKITIKAGNKTTKTTRTPAKSRARKTDARKGTDQTVDTFWVSVANHYNTHLPDVLRSANSLKNRWSNIVQPEVNKFSGCVTQIANKNPSGATGINRFTMAMNMFQEMYGHQFAFVACYEVLLKSPKWNEYCRAQHQKKTSTKTPKKPKQPESDPNTSPTHNGNEMERESFGDETSGPPTRPDGRKLAKLEHPVEIVANKNHETFQKMAAAHCEIAEGIKKQAELLEAQNKAMEQMANEAIMSKDLTHVSDRVRRYYEVLQDKILNKMEESERSTQLNGEASTNTSGSHQASSLENWYTCDAFKLSSSPV
ncbi:hypothetical protein Pst134EB_010045 [Puccinia striiformis f. sp. tritici]|nr:hypothetical protein Pst134EB_010045 [Puccinia striiformis f. sp. tritici]